MVTNKKAAKIAQEINDMTAGFLAIAKIENGELKSSLTPEQIEEKLHEANLKKFTLSKLAVMYSYFIKDRGLQQEFDKVANLVQKHIESQIKGYVEHD